jgi:hypothetical protein
MELVHELIEIVARGGNFLLNIGPTGGGELPWLQVQRFLQIGWWLRRYGTAIYGTRPWDPSTGMTKDGMAARCTASDDAVTPSCLARQPRPRSKLTLVCVTTRSSCSKISPERWSGSRGRTARGSRCRSLPTSSPPSRYVSRLGARSRDRHPLDRRTQPVRALRATQVDRARSPVPHTERRGTEENVYVVARCDDVRTILGAHVRFSRVGAGPGSDVSDEWPPLAFDRNDSVSRSPVPASSP